MVVESKIDGCTPLSTDAEFSHLEPTEQSISFLDLLLTLVRRRKVVFKFVFFSLLTAILAILLLPNIYTSDTKILPPQQSQSLSTVLLGQLGPLANFAGKDLMKSSGDLYISMLRSRTVEDALILRFDLQKIYGEKSLGNTREKLDKATAITEGKDGIITISFEDENSERAAQIANGYVEELFKLNQSLAIVEASHRRLFFEKELHSAKEDLTAAEAELKKTQEATGLIQLDGQARAIIDAVAAVRGQIAVKEVQIRAMRSFGTEQNPDIIRAGQELQELRSQLYKLEQGNKRGNGDIQVATGKVPAAGMEYIRKLRDVKYYEAIFEILAKQYEIAKLDESKNAPTIQVIDPAVVAERRTRPKRTLLLALAFFIGIFFAFLWITISDAIASLLKNPTERARLESLRAALVQIRLRSL
jgi:tyrosine-protein kinase Etk/Wzc